MHGEADRAWVDASTAGEYSHNSPLGAKAYVDGGSDAPLPSWVDEVLDGDGPLDAPDGSGSILARFVRDLTEAIPDATERHRVLRAGLLGAAGRLADGSKGEW